MGGGRRDGRWRVIVDWVCEGSRTAASNRGVESQGDQHPPQLQPGFLCFSACRLRNRHCKVTSRSVEQPSCSYPECSGPCVVVVGNFWDTCVGSLCFFGAL